MATDDNPRSGTTLAFRLKMLVAVLVGLGFGLVWYALLALVVVAAAIGLVHLLT